jgi:Flp pilus assembly protein TadG
MITRLRNDERGQSLLITVFFLTVLIGATAFTLDIGVWYREQRQAQAAADQAVLSGAQTLPLSTAQALTDTQTYANTNGGTVVPGTLKLLSDFAPEDTVAVTVERTAPSFFAKIFSIGDVKVRAKAAARAAIPLEVEGAAPIVVNELHPLLKGTPGCPCFNQETTIPLSKAGAPGAFDLVDFDNQTANGNPDLASWIQLGYPGTLELGDYDSAPGAKFNSGGITGALNKRTGTELLFPVYDTLSGGGSGAQYDVIGWVAFHLDCFGLPAGDTDCKNQNGNNQTLTGYFTRTIWKGIQSKANQHLPDFGVYSVSLTN